MNTSSKISAAFCVGLLLLGAAHHAAALPIYGVTLVSGANRLVRFESSTPGTINLDIPITGLQAGELIQGIDFRPATAQLYALGVTASSGVYRLYVINTATGAATAVGSPGTTTVAGSNFGFDFDPETGSVRLVSNADENLLINPNNGAFSDTQGILDYADSDPNGSANPNVVGLAYFNNVQGATVTTLYGIDVSLDILVVQDPEAGTLTTKGSLGVNTTFVIGFDIATTAAANIAFATLSVSGVTGLYVINLNTGAAALVGMVGTGTPNLVDMAVSLEPQTFVVTDTTDPGNGVCDASCNLREAINAANSKPGLDLIHFNIPGGGVRTILPASVLPAITDTVTINGYSQPGASPNTLAVGNNAVLQIQLNGQSAGNVIAGLVIRAAGCVVRGLVINRFPNEAIIIEHPPSPATRQATRNTIEGNYIGTDAAGTTALGNGSGVTLSSFDNTIGGTSPAARNLISGSTTGSGIWMKSIAALNEIEGNYIGTDKNGTAVLPNGARGIFIESGGNSIGSTQPGAGNLISGNALRGIEIKGVLGLNNHIEGNLIGTNATGIAALENLDSGVLITNASNNTIGGASAAARNVISGNQYYGVFISNGENNRVLGNFIGTDAAGQADLGNSLTGVVLLHASGSEVGGPASGEGNLISGNDTGVGISGSGSTNNSVQGNRIGTDAAGGPLGNAVGIFIGISATGTTVGGPGSAGNTIAFNSMSGVALAIGTGHGITGNSIFSNGGLGIDLQGGTEDSHGVTANDSLDADTGPNRLQNYPVLTGITGTGSTRTVQGLLNSAPTTGYNIHFYRNDAVDPSGFGEGQTPLGVLYVQTDEQGHTSFSFPLDSNATGQYITATATDPNGNTSEFSMASNLVPGPPPTPSPTATATATATATPAASVIPTPGSTPIPSPTVAPTPTPSPSPVTQAINLSTRMQVQTGDNVGIGGFIITGSAPKHVIVRAIGPSLINFGVPNVLTDPVLELHGPSGFATIINNSWRDDQEAEIQATGIPPTDNFESAIVATLAPGAYTAILRGNGDTSGVALVEAYDLNQSAASKLANLSTRAFVSTESDIVIAGFLLSDNNVGDRIVVRGIGPSLAALGVTNALANPNLELRDSDGTLLVANNDWQDNPLQASEIIAAGLAPTNDFESAIAATLPPGLYTALLAGLNYGTGIGVVEVYDRGP